ncbi:MAG: hypothetical protein SVU32_09335 [Candidatus Nanohaloarchaea archaeon]|nr:hypothetical protein [Candidatus Nanohaloarchaea archaeon]
MIDATDYSILKVLENSEQGLWKNEIHRRILDSIDTIPGLNSLSIQTVGRRVNSLYEDELLDAYLKNVESVNRTLITVHHLTEKGKKELDQYREHLLRTYLLRHMEDRLLTQEEPTICEATLRDVFCSHHDISPQELDTELTVDCILSYLQKNYTITEKVQPSVRQLEQHLEH